MSATVAGMGSAATAAVDQHTDLSSLAEQLSTASGRVSRDALLRLADGYLQCVDESVMSAPLPSQGPEAVCASDVSALRACIVSASGSEPHTLMKAQQRWRKEGSSLTYSEGGHKRLRSLLVDVGSLLMKAYIELRHESGEENISVGRGLHPDWTNLSESSASLRAALSACEAHTSLLFEHSEPVADDRNSSQQRLYVAVYAFLVKARHDVDAISVALARRDSAIELFAAIRVGAPRQAQFDRVRVQPLVEALEHSMPIVSAASMPYPDVGTAGQGTLSHCLASLRSGVGSCESTELRSLATTCGVLAAMRTCVIAGAWGDLQRLIGSQEVLDTAVDIVTSLGGGTRRAFAVDTQPLIDDVPAWCRSACLAVSAVAEIGAYSAFLHALSLAHTVGDVISGLDQRCDDGRVSVHNWLAHAQMASVKAVFSATSLGALQLSGLSGGNSVAAALPAHVLVSIVEHIVAPLQSAADFVAGALHGLTRPEGGDSSLPSAASARAQSLAVARISDALHTLLCDALRSTASTDNGEAVDTLADHVIASQPLFTSISRSVLAAEREATALHAALNCREALLHSLTETSNAAGPSASTLSVLRSALATCDSGGAASYHAYVLPLRQACELVLSVLSDPGAFTEPATVTVSGARSATDPSSGCVHGLPPTLGAELAPVCLAVLRADDVRNAINACASALQAASGLDDASSLDSAALLRPAPHAALEHALHTAISHSHEGQVSLQLPMATAASLRACSRQVRRVLRIREALVSRDWDAAIGLLALTVAGPANGAFDLDLDYAEGCDEDAASGAEPRSAELSTVALSPSFAPLLACCTRETTLRSALSRLQSAYQSSAVRAQPCGIMVLGSEAAEQEGFVAGVVPAEVVPPSCAAPSAASLSQLTSAIGGVSDWAARYESDASAAADVRCAQLVVDVLESAGMLRQLTRSAAHGAVSSGAATVGSAGSSEQLLLSLHDTAEELQRQASTLLDSARAGLHRASPAAELLGAYASAVGAEASSIVLFAREARLCALLGPAIGATSSGAGPLESALAAVRRGAGVSATDLSEGARVLLRSASVLAPLRAYRAAEDWDGLQLALDTTLLQSEEGEGESSAALVLVKPAAQEVREYAADAAHRLLIPVLTSAILDCSVKPVTDGASSPSAGGGSMPGHASPSPGHALLSPSRAAVASPSKVLWASPSRLRSPGLRRTAGPSEATGSTSTLAGLDVSCVDTVALQTALSLAEYRSTLDCGSASLPGALVSVLRVLAPIRLAAVRGDRASLVNALQATPRSVWPSSGDTEIDNAVALELGFLRRALGIPADDANSSVPSSPPASLVASTSQHSSALTIQLSPTCPFALITAVRLLGAGGWAAALRQLALPLSAWPQHDDTAPLGKPLLQLREAALTLDPWVHRVITAATGAADSAGLNPAAIAQAAAWHATPQHRGVVEALLSHLKSWLVVRGAMSVLRDDSLQHQDSLVRDDDSHTLDRSRVDVLGFLPVIQVATALEGSHPPLQPYASVALAVLRLVRDARAALLTCPTPRAVARQDRVVAPSEPGDGALQACLRTAQQMVLLPRAALHAASRAPSSSAQLPSDIHVSRSRVSTATTTFDGNRANISDDSDSTWLRRAAPAPGAGDQHVSALRAHHFAPQLVACVAHEIPEGLDGTGSPLQFLLGPVSRELRCMQEEVSSTACVRALSAALVQACVVDAAQDRAGLAAAALAVGSALNLAADLSPTSPLALRWVFACRLVSPLLRCAQAGSWVELEGRLRDGWQSLHEAAGSTLPLLAHLAQTLRAACGSRGLVETVLGSFAQGSPFVSDGGTEGIVGSPSAEGVSVDLYRTSPAPLRAALELIARAQSMIGRGDPEPVGLPQVEPGTIVHVLPRLQRCAMVLARMRQAVLSGDWAGAEEAVAEAAMLPPAAQWLPETFAAPANALDAGLALEDRALVLPQGSSAPAARTRDASRRSRYTTDASDEQSSRGSDDDSESVAPPSAPALAADLANLSVEQAFPGLPHPSARHEAATVLRHAHMRRLQAALVSALSKGAIAGRPGSLVLEGGSVSALNAVLSQAVRLATSPYPLDAPALSAFLEVVASASLVRDVRAAVLTGRIERTAAVLSCVRDEGAGLALSLPAIAAVIQSSDTLGPEAGNSDSDASSDEGPHAVRRQPRETVAAPGAYRDPVSRCEGLFPTSSTPSHEGGSDGALLPLHAACTHEISLLLGDAHDGRAAQMLRAALVDRQSADSADDEACVSAIAFASSRPLSSQRAKALLLTARLLLRLRALRRGEDWQGILEELAATRRAYLADAGSGGSADSAVSGGSPFAQEGAAEVQAHARAALVHRATAGIVESLALPAAGPASEAQLAAALRAADESLGLSSSRASEPDIMRVGRLILSLRSAVARGDWDAVVDALAMPTAQRMLPSQLLGALSHLMPHLAPLAEPAQARAPMPPAPAGSRGVTSPPPRRRPGPPSGPNPMPLSSPPSRPAATPAPPRTVAPRASPVPSALARTQDAAAPATGWSTTASPSVPHAAVDELAACAREWVTRSLAGKLHAAILAVRDALAANSGFAVEHAACSAQLASALQLAASTGQAEEEGIAQLVSACEALQHLLLVGSHLPASPSVAAAGLTEGEDGVLPQALSAVSEAEDALAHSATATVVDRHAAVSVLRVARSRVNLDVSFAAALHGLSSDDPAHLRALASLLAGAVAEAAAACAPAAAVLPTAVEALQLRCTALASPVLSLCEAVSALRESRGAYVPESADMALAGVAACRRAIKRAYGADRAVLAALASVLSPVLQTVEARANSAKAAASLLNARALLRSALASSGPVGQPGELDIPAAAVAPLIDALQARAQLPSGAPPAEDGKPAIAPLVSAAKALLTIRQAALAAHARAQADPWSIDAATFTPPTGLPADLPPAVSDEHQLYSLHFLELQWARRLTSALSTPVLTGELGRLGVNHEALTALADAVEAATRVEPPLRSPACGALFTVAESAVEVFATLLAGGTPDWTAVGREAGALAERVRSIVHSPGLAHGVARDAAVLCWEARVRATMAQVAEAALALCDDGGAYNTTERLALPDAADHVAAALQGRVDALARSMQDATAVTAEIASDPRLDLPSACMRLLACCDALLAATMQALGYLRQCAESTGGAPASEPPLVSWQPPADQLAALALFATGPADVLMSPRKGTAPQLRYPAAVASLAAAFQRALVSAMASAHLHAVLVPRLLAAFDLQPPLISGPPGEPEVRTADVDAAASAVECLAAAISTLGGPAAADALLCLSAGVQAARVAVQALRTMHIRQWAEAAAIIAAFDASEVPRLQLAAGSTASSIMATSLRIIDHARSETDDRACVQALTDAALCTALYVHVPGAAPSADGSHLSRVDQARASENIALLRAAIESAERHIDTVSSTGNSFSERLGRGIEAASLMLTARSAAVDGDAEVLAAALSNAFAALQEQQLLPGSNDGILQSCQHELLALFTEAEALSAVQTAVQALSAGAPRPGRNSALELELSNLVWEHLGTVADALRASPAASHALTRQTAAQVCEACAGLQRLRPALLALDSVYHLGNTPQSPTGHQAESAAHVAAMNEFLSALSPFQHPPASNGAPASSPPVRRAVRTLSFSSGTSASTSWPESRPETPWDRLCAPLTDLQPEAIAAEVTLARDHVVSLLLSLPLKAGLASGGPSTLGSGPLAGLDVSLVDANQLQAALLQAVHAGAALGGCLPAPLLPLYRACLGVWALRCELTVGSSDAWRCVEALHAAFAASVPDEGVVTTLAGVLQDAEVRLGVAPNASLVAVHLISINTDTTAAAAAHASAAKAVSATDVRGALSTTQLSSIASVASGAGISMDSGAGAVDDRRLLERGGSLDAPPTGHTAGVLALKAWAEVRTVYSCLSAGSSLGACVVDVQSGLERDDEAVLTRGMQAAAALGLFLPDYLEPHGPRVDEDLLRMSAVVAGLDAEVGSLLAAGAERVQQLLTARAVLASACASRSLPELEQALDSAARAGLQPECFPDLATAQELSEVLLGLRAALLQGLARCDASALTACLEQAEALGAPLPLDPADEAPVQDLLALPPEAQLQRQLRAALASDDASQVARCTVALKARVLTESAFPLHACSVLVPSLRQALSASEGLPSSALAGPLTMSARVEPALSEAASRLCRAVNAYAHVSRGCDGSELDASCTGNHLSTAMAQQVLASVAGLPRGSQAAQVMSDELLFALVLTAHAHLAGSLPPKGAAPSEAASMCIRLLHRAFHEGILPSEAAENYLEAWLLTAPLPELPETEASREFTARRTELAGRSRACEELLLALHEATYRASRSA